jgi:hypothetical protein
LNPFADAAGSRHWKPVVGRLKMSQDVSQSDGMLASLADDNWVCRRPVKKLMFHDLKCILLMMYIIDGSQRANVMDVIFNTTSTVKLFKSVISDRSLGIGSTPQILS